MTDDERYRVDEYVRHATGGPAFGRFGLTALDYFAAAALQGLLAFSADGCDADGQSDPDRAAVQAYQFAAAMLDRRRELMDEMRMNATPAEV